MIFAKIFRENSAATRRSFFSHPLIKYIWSHVFITEPTNICLKYLRKVRSQPEHGKGKVDRLVKDMIENETAFNFKMVPDSVKDSDNIEAFSQ